jgi:hypothetical protein
MDQVILVQEILQEKKLHKFSREDIEQLIKDCLKAVLKIDDYIQELELELCKRNKNGT